MLYFFNYKTVNAAQPMKTLNPGTALPFSILKIIRYSHTVIKQMYCGWPAARK